MSSNSESETEILLGNRHLLAIFFVLAILLGIAFTGGYMAGRNSPEKKLAPVTANSDQSAKTSEPSNLETHSLPPATEQGADAAVADDSEKPVKPAKRVTEITPPPAVTAAPQDAPLGARKAKLAAPPEPVHATAPAPKPQPVKQAAAAAEPLSGETFLQVAAVGHPEAKALADVLSKKGFRAHAVAKPGATDVYRVLVGPLRDAGELAATRDSLRNAGFTKIFVQKLN